jgi:putative transposase
MLSRKELRKDFVNKKNSNHEEKFADKPWVTKTPYDIRNVIAFDPGMRTFCTGYDPDGIIVEVGKSDISRIDKLCYHYDKLQSTWSQPEINHRKGYRCKRAGARMQHQIQNLVDELYK